jgi:hypothetical protein
MGNLLLSIIKKAHEQKWCTTPYCTTCGASDYRNALKELAGPLGGGLANALAEINPQDLTSIPNWQDALLVAIIDLPISLQTEVVLKAWLPKTTDNIFFADFAVFRILRYLPKDNETRNRWIEHCMNMAVSTKNFPLIESLILLLRQDALNYPDLIAIAKEYAKTSSQMRRVLHNACNLNVPANHPNY